MSLILRNPGLPWRLQSGMSWHPLLAQVPEMTRILLGPNPSLPRIGSRSGGLFRRTTGLTSILSMHGACICPLQFDSAAS